MDEKKAVRGSRRVKTGEVSKRRGDGLISSRIKDIPAGRGLGPGGVVLWSRRVVDVENKCRGAENRGRRGTGIGGRMESGKEDLLLSSTS